MWRIPSGIAAAAILSGILGGSVAPAATPPAELVATDAGAAPTAAAAEFEARKDRYIDAMVESESGYFHFEAAVGLLLLERAQRTGDHSEVDRANELVLASLPELELTLANNQYSAQHGGAFALLGLALRFGDEPELLYPETYDALVRGEFPDGSSRPEHSLLAYRDQFFADGYEAQNVGLDVRDGEPWDPAGYDTYNGTKNHKLQSLVTGMLLAEIYADDEVGGVPVRNDTEDLDDQWHYYVDAFWRFSHEWGDGRGDHLTSELTQTEEDSIQYFATHLGDYWLLRDLHSDPAVSAHAEVMVDRLLADWSEDLIGPMTTGPNDRTYTVDLDAGLSHQQHVLNYLLFGDADDPLPDTLYGWGGWANIAVATSDYGPGSPDFPMVLVDIARDKRDGYTVREGGADHNWLESDFSLGLRLDGTVSVEDLAGGFHVMGAAGDRAAGRLITIFHGETPFSKDKPSVTVMGVQAERTALYRTVNRSDPARLWVQSGFDEVIADGRWLFIEHETWSDRTVYLAIGIGAGELSELDEVDGGRVFEFRNAGDISVWQVATSDDVANFEEFQGQMHDAELNVGGGTADYVSPFGGQALHFDQDPEARTVGGEPVDWSAYEYSFNNPWGAHAFGTTTAAVERDGQSVEWDWDPNDSGAYDEPPVKVVVNRET